MGHWCRICGATKSNESFSGKGHKNHICKECSRKPKEEIEKIDHLEEIFNFMDQSNISKKNKIRLKELVNSENIKISELAKLVLEVAMIKATKKGRIKLLAKENRQLLFKLEEEGLVPMRYYWGPH